MRALARPALAIAISTLGSGAWLFVACGGAQTTVNAALAPADAAVDARDAGIDAQPLALPAVCPEDAPWTGTICRGHGYVSCPGQMHLDGGLCARNNGAPLSAVGRLTEGEPREKDAGEEEEEEKPRRLRGDDP